MFFHGLKYFINQTHHHFMTVYDQFFVDRVITPITGTAKPQRDRNHNNQTPPKLGWVYPETPQSSSLDLSTSLIVHIYSNIPIVRNAIAIKIIKPNIYPLNIAYPGIEQLFV